jgi:hypothetical protein
MGKLDSVFHNFANHVTSGLSGFITAAYDACERASVNALALKLLPEAQMHEAVREDVEFASSVRSLRDKFAEILAKESGARLDQISELEVAIDFLPDASRVGERRRVMETARVCYGYNPVYRCTVKMRETHGKRWECTFEDLD